MGIWKIPHLSMIFPLRPSFIEDFPAMFDNTGGDANRRPQDYRRTDLQAGESTKAGFSARWPKMTWITATWSNPQKNSAV